MAITAFLDYISLEKKYSSNTLKAYKKNLDDFQKFILSTIMAFLLKRLLIKKLDLGLSLVEQEIVKELLIENLF